LRIAEGRAHFRVDDVSAVASARKIKVPVLLIHGAKDDETPPAHSTRVLEALAGRKKLIMIPGTGHNDAMRAAPWGEIEAWLPAARRGVRSLRTAQDCSADRAA